MPKIIKCQRIDGKLVIKLPEGVTAKDFEDWLNDKHLKSWCEGKPTVDLQFEMLPETWTSAGEE